MCPQGRTLINSTWQQQCTNKMGQLVGKDRDMVKFSVFNLLYLKGTKGFPFSLPHFP